MLLENSVCFVSLTSGTNINEALMKAVQMLLKALSQGQIDQRSVSMIILVSDGDPTVGKGHPPPPHTHSHAP